MNIENRLRKLEEAARARKPFGERMAEEMTDRELVAVLMRTYPWLPADPAEIDNETLEAIAADAVAAEGPSR